MATSLFIKTPGVSANPNLEPIARDPVLVGSNGGVLFAFDLAFDWCYNGATPPANAKPVKDMSDKGDGALSIRAGQTIANAGGGIDFSGVTNDAVVIRGPVGCLAPLQDEQEFAVITWIKLPASEDWSTAVPIAPLFTTSDAGGYTAGPDLLTIAQSSDPRLSVRRQTAGATHVTSNVLPTLFYGKVCQILYARSATGTILQIRSATDTVAWTGAAGALNTGSFAALSPQWGVVEAFNNLADAAHRNAAKYRIYRGLIENLHQSGRDPLEVAARDFDFVTQLGRYS